MRREAEELCLTRIVDYDRRAILIAIGLAVVEMMNKGMKEDFPKNVLQITSRLGIRLYKCFLCFY